MRDTQTAAQGDILQFPIINPQSAIPQLAVGKIRQKATECDRTLRKLVRARALLMVPLWKPQSAVSPLDSC